MAKVVEKIVDMEKRRHAHVLKQKDVKADELRASFKKAREAAAGKPDGTQKLLKMFKKKPRPKR